VFTEQEYTQPRCAPQCMADLYINVYVYLLTYHRLVSYCVPAKQVSHSCHTQEIQEIICVMYVHRTAMRDAVWNGMLV